MDLYFKSLMMHILLISDHHIIMKMKILLSTRIMIMHIKVGGLE